jgi:hypothetical protein
MSLEVPDTTLRKLTKEVEDPLDQVKGMEAALV